MAGDAESISSLYSCLAIWLVEKRPVKKNAFTSKICTARLCAVDGGRGGVWGGLQGDWGACLESCKAPTCAAPHIYMHCCPVRGLWVNVVVWGNRGEVLLPVDLCSTLMVLHPCVQFSPLPFSRG